MKSSMIFCRQYQKKNFGLAIEWTGLGFCEVIGFDKENPGKIILSFPKEDGGKSSVYSIKIEKAEMANIKIVLRR